MTDIDITEATRLAAEARCEWAGCDDPPCPMPLGQQRTAVAAALPALAEQFAALILAHRHSSDMHILTYPSGGVCVHCDRMETAARLVREAAEVTG